LFAARAAARFCTCADNYFGSKRFNGLSDHQGIIYLYISIGCGWTFLDSLSAGEQKGRNEKKALKTMTNIPSDPLRRFLTRVEFDAIFHVSHSKGYKLRAMYVEPVSVNPQTFSLPNSGSPPERAEPIRQQA
jgi:hypothetical protein